MIKNMEIENSNVNTYGKDTESSEVKGSKNCQKCLWIDSCKNYWNKILSNPQYNAQEIYDEVIKFKCDHYSPIDELYNEVTYDRDNYGIEYNTYLHEFNNG